MRITLYGVRGSLPAPMNTHNYHQKISHILKRAVDKDLTTKEDITTFIKNLPSQLKYPQSGNTTCTAVESSSGATYVIDGGTGIRELGESLMNGPLGKGEGVLHMFITHFHWDHIQGIPFFKPLMIKGNKIHFYSPYKNFENFLLKQQSTPFFPASMDQYASEKHFHTIDPESTTALELEPGFLIDWYPLKHPGGSFAYRFQESNKSFIFATDAEFTGEILETMVSKTDFFNDADLLVLDSQYTLQDSFSKFDWGHTSYTMAVNCACHWNVKNLVMTHHDPAYDDWKLHENLAAAKEHAKNIGKEKTNILLAREGMSFSL